MVPLLVQSGKGGDLPLAQFFVEFSVETAERALKFYGNVFNWASVRADGPIEYHLMGEVGGPTVAGLLPTPFAPHTLVYMRSSGLEETLGRVREFGGKVILSQRIEGLGSVAQWKDPHGNRFGLTQVDEGAPLLTIAPERIATHPPHKGRSAGGHPVYVEIAVEDAEDALAFYGKVFDWTSFHVEGQQLPYHLAGEENGATQVAIMPTAFAPRSLVYFRVDDLKHTLDQVGRHGGAAVRSREQGGVGLVAQCKDPDGNAFGLVQIHENAPLIRMNKETLAAALR